MIALLGGLHPKKVIYLKNSVYFLYKYYIIMISVLFLTHTHYIWELIEKSSFYMPRCEVGI